MITDRQKTALSLLEQAEVCIDNHYIDFARDFICGLDEWTYDLFLAWAAYESLGYKFYLARYVMESIEPPSTYTVKDGVSQDLAIYKANLTLIRTIPSDILSTPYKPPVKPKHTRDKSKTLAMPFL